MHIRMIMNKMKAEDNIKSKTNNSEMGLLLLLTWVVFTLFGVNLALKVE